MRAQKYNFYPVTPSRWNDFEKLFGKRGACGGCWCMAWRLDNSTWEAGKKNGANKREMKKLIDKNSVPGIIAYADKEPIAWCSVSKREDFKKLKRSRVLAPVDDLPVWSVSCLFIKKEFRRKGFSSELIKAACDFARKKKAEILEGYPYDIKNNLPGPFVWTGLLKSYKRVGFKEVMRRSKTRPIVRAKLK